MKKFTEIHSENILGTLSCFDRILFRGYLPFYSGKEMQGFLLGKKLLYKDLKPYLQSQSEEIINHAKAMAEKLNRPFIYLNGGDLRKDDEAKKIASQNKIESGLICVFRRVEPNRTFKLKYGERCPKIESHHGQCLTLYFYFLDKDYGLIHVRLSTWFPLDVQIYVNGHEWLARKLDQKKIKYVKDDNAFLSVENFKRAQSISDSFVNLNHKKFLDRMAKLVNPLLGKDLGTRQYYWVTTQAELSFDILFKNKACLENLYPAILEHSVLCTTPDDILHFLSRKMHGNFEGPLSTQFSDLTRKRIPGVRVKHQMKGNRIKMYNKSGSVLRVETVINSPEEFKVRKTVTRNGVKTKRWVPLRKSIYYLWRLRQVAQLANERYLNALAIVTDPSEAIQGLDRVSTPAKTTDDRSVKPFSPLTKESYSIFIALLSGEFHVLGFKNKDLRLKLKALQGNRTIKQFSGWLTRLFSRLRFFGIISKIPRSSRYKMTQFGRKILEAAIKVRKLLLPQEYQCESKVGTPRSYRYAVIGVWGPSAIYWST